jgi:hypothetical protein
VVTPAEETEVEAPAEPSRASVIAVKTLETVGTAVAVVTAIAMTYAAGYVAFQFIPV